MSAHANCPGADGLLILSFDPPLNQAFAADQNQGFGALVNYQSPMAATLRLEIISDGSNGAVVLAAQELGVASGQGTVELASSAALPGGGAVSLDVTQLAPGCAGVADTIVYNQGPGGGANPPPPPSPVPGGGTSVDFARFVMEGLYGRPTVPGEAEVLAADLDAGRLTPAQAVAGLAVGAERQQFVAPMARLYQAAFDRLPDRPGLDYWVAVFRANTAAHVAIADGFAASAEFQARYGADLSAEAFIDQLYLNVLDRPADAAGLANWTAAFEGGASRGTMVVAFADSAENIAQGEGALTVWLIYQLLLGRPPSEGELAQNTGRDPAALAAELLGSPGYVGPDLP
ncbi:MAG: DUF4214 domain-containing protein [Candidatus Competibacterales bacterium]